jgi:hypothetical protein
MEGRDTWNMEEKSKQIKVSCETKIATSDEINKIVLMHDTLL